MSNNDTQRGDGKLNTIIGKGSTFLGNIEVSGGLRIDGKVEGNIKADSVFIGREAEVHGDITVHTAIVGGKIWGNMHTSALELQTKAELYGDLATKNLIIAENAIFQGTCDMGFRDRIKQRPAEAPASEEPVATVEASQPTPEPEPGVSTPE